MQSQHDVILPTAERETALNGFLTFLLEAKTVLKQNMTSAQHPKVEQIRAPLEEHYVDDQGKPAMYQRFESAIYDDARSMVTLWAFFESYSLQQLRSFQVLVQMELDGLNGDRHPRKVFDRSPFGIAAIVVGTITIWMTILRTYTGDDLSIFLEAIRFNSIAGVIWIVGLFVVLWFILKTVRNNHQVAFLSTIGRALELYLNDEIGSSSVRGANISKQSA